jgi:transcriptional regulator with XRE-family HTH domain
MSIGTNIKKIRESKNLSIDYMAKTLKVFKSAYTDVENSIKVANDTLLSL